MSVEALLSTAEAADRLGCTAGAVNRWAREDRVIVERQDPGPLGSRWFTVAVVEALAAELAECHGCACAPSVKVRDR